MTVLIDNVAEGPLIGEWGLSIMIDADDRRILLDTGASGQFAQNAECLDIDLNSVEIGVLSHAHYDHVRGAAVHDAPLPVGGHGFSADRLPG